ncbi:LysR family transcriptional regulator [Leisingera daeponensis]|uniref:LysR family transcriptional regulator n=1 Tax=Leisingera daeponensis TaxID=405746 RepID=A0ABS7NIZ3_9RHOB|nr:LysR substrate-binding domain-containing protein [Leisingera daeponensis]MBY6141163.1 LysR family transcriptional regulator [Leisingera daeponensis]
MKNLPHLTFLRSFEAAARYLSFTSAADELNCTQSAVSNHVRSLEEFIGRPLFVRHPRSLSLTDVGEAYLPSVRHALQEIDSATQLLISQSHKREVVISCPVSLAERWLLKVIEGFSAAHPDIDLTIHSTIWVDVETNVSDISITINHVDDVMGPAVKLWDEKLALVCAPDFQVAGEVLTRPEQLVQAKLIHILGRPIYWEKIAKHYGLAGIELKGGLQTNSSNMGLEFAANGLGCAVLPKTLVRFHVADGRLVEPFDFDLDCPWTYFATFKDKAATPSVKHFKTWLLKAAAEMDV